MSYDRLQSLLDDHRGALGVRARELGLGLPSGPFFLDQQGLAPGELVLGVAEQRFDASLSQTERLRSPRSPSAFFTIRLAFDRRSLASDRPTLTWLLVNLAALRRT